MADEFIESLLAAVETFVQGLAATPGSRDADALEALIGIPEALAKLGDHPAALKIDSEHMGIARIRDADPDFDIAAFLVRVGEMFSAYHTAMDRGDLAPVRRFVDERYYPDLLQAAEKTGRNPNGPRALTVRAIRPMTASHYLGMDMIRVFITANQSGTKELLCEYWELIRKQGTLTKPDLDLTSCPNCGGPVDGLDHTRCSYCGTRLADPAHDWVVRSILPQ
jgi:hypothetical protein